MLRRHLEQHFNRVWYQHGRVPLFYRALAQVYKTWVKPRCKRPTLTAPVPVIVVGNLTVGGGGKTPLVIALARHLSSAGYQVAVISRGYGGRRRTLPYQVQANDTAAMVGDEPLLIAEQTGAPVWVCSKRSEALAAAVKAGVKVVISDDGLQHLALPRTFEICLLDGARGFGNGELLPAGPLRQPQDRLADVDLVLVKGEGQVAGQAVRVDLLPERISQLDGSDSEPPDAWQGRAVHAVCGIANPAGFFRTLEALGMQIKPLAFPDHHPFKAEDFHGLAGAVVVTAKDAVKLRALGLDRSVHVLHVGMSLPAAVTTAVEKHLMEWSSAHE